MPLKNLVLFLPVIALALAVTVASPWPEPAFAALGPGPMPFDPALLPGLGVEVYDLMLCSPIDTRCGYNWLMW